MLQEQFGLHLRKIRLSNGYTQAQISEQLNISRQAYSNYEQGRCLPAVTTLAQLSILLEANLFELFLEDSMNEQKNQNKEREVYNEFTKL